jgi:phosphoserine phosphatase
MTNVTDRLHDAGCSVIGHGWIDEGSAFDVAFEGDAVLARAALEGPTGPVDIVVQKTVDRRRKLIVADMDSTMITVECIDELADYAGIKDQIAEVTERAMRGDLDFEGALRSRVALLAGLDESAIEQCLAERVRIMPGARALVQTMRSNGGHAVLVSGGFTRFAEPVGDLIGFDTVIANTLGIIGGKLDGTVATPIIGAEAKLTALRGALAQKGWDVASSLAVGDGANDIAMIEAAGLGVAYHAKPKTEAAAAASIRYGDLSTLLYAMGFPRKQWSSDQA